jgi:hypothetical protein
MKQMHSHHIVIIAAEGGQSFEILKVIITGFSLNEKIE